MNYLIVNTSGLKNVVVLSVNGTTDMLYFKEGEKPSECLLNKINLILEKNKLTLKDIDVFSAVVGPGSFTGTRIGLSTIYGFCYGQDKPFVKINLFDLIEENDNMIFAAHAGGAYAKKENNYVFLNKDELKQLLDTDGQHAICLSFEADYFENKPLKIDFAECAVKYVAKRIEKGEYDSIFSTEPFYIEKSQAEVSLERSLKTLEIRQATANDADEILNLENVCFDSDRYSRETILSEIKKSFNTFLVGLIDGKIVCYAIFSKPFDEGEIIKICVIDKFRKMGLAQKMFDEFVMLKKPKKLFLEVNIFNIAAINLYKKIGFNQIAVRKNYYANGDDALIFAKTF